jgi:hypothetical protein
MKTPVMTEAEKALVLGDDRAVLLADLAATEAKARESVEVARFAGIDCPPFEQLPPHTQAQIMGLAAEYRRAKQAERDREEGW